MEQSTFNVAAVVQKNETMNSFDNYKGPFHVKKNYYWNELFAYEMEAKKLQKGNIGRLFDDDIPS